MFAAADLLSCSSSDSDKYKCAWIKAKVIRSSILSAGEFPYACSIALYIELNHKDIESIMVVSGDIYRKQHSNAITRHGKKKKRLSHATSVGNK